MSASLDKNYHLFLLVIGWCIMKLGENKQYQVVFQRRAGRIEAVMFARNLAFVKVGLKLVERPYGVASWELTT